MATYYPPCEDKHEYCELCNKVQTHPSSCTSTTAKNTVDPEAAKRKCETYCDTGCNSECDEPQTVCLRGPEYIKDHPDVGSYTWGEVKPEDLIHEKWSADYWNGLIGQIEAAEGIGKNSPHGSAGSISASIGGTNLYTAKLYNEVNTKLCNFRVSYNRVNEEDLITATIANAIKTAYESARFKSTVCDNCDEDQSIKGGCNCNCSCPCSCNCGCSCPCSCNCGCSCGCTCNKNTTETPAAKNSVRQIWKI